VADSQLSDLRRVLIHERARLHEERAGSRFTRRLERDLDLSGELPDVEGEHRPLPMQSSRLSLLPGPLASRRQPIPEDRNRRRSWSQLLQKLEPLSGRLRQLKAQPGEVPARLCEARDEPLGHRGRSGNHHDGNRRRRLLERRQRGSGADDHVDLKTDEFGSQVGEPFDLALGRTGLGDEVLTIDVAELTHSTEERAYEGTLGPGAGQLGGRVKRGTQDPDPVELPARLATDNAGARKSSERQATDERTSVRHATG
jgi:hypothetical protein